MRNDNAFGVNLSFGELQLCYELLTKLKADHLLDEASRRRALEFLEPKWLLARDATNRQVSSSVTEGN